MTSDFVNHQFFMELRRDLDAVRADLKELREFVAHLDGQCQSYAKMNTGHIEYIYNAIRVVEDQISPIEEKIFPAVSNARDELARIADEQKATAKRESDQAD